MCGRRLRDKKDRVMGEFNKDPNQSGTGKEEQGDKPAFGQFDKQQGQQDTGQEKGADTGQSRQQFGEDKSQAGQQFTQDQSPPDQGKQDELAGVRGDQQQQANKTQRQQGDEDL